MLVQRSDSNILDMTVIDQPTEILQFNDTRRLCSLSTNHNPDTWFAYFVSNETKNEILTKVQGTKCPVDFDIPKHGTSLTTPCHLKNGCFVTVYEFKHIYITYKEMNKIQYRIKVLPTTGNGMTIVAICLDKMDNIYALDIRNKVISKFNLQGDFLKIVHNFSDTPDTMAISKDEEIWVVFPGGRIEIVSI